MSGQASGEEYSPKIIILVPRIPSRRTLDQCRAEAMRIARKSGLSGEPEVEEYDGLNPWHGPMANPQGYRFLWDVPESSGGGTSN